MFRRYTHGRCFVDILKVLSHATIGRVRFVFWRMRNTTDAILRHRLSSSPYLKCDLFTRAHSIAYASRVRIVPDKS